MVILKKLSKLAKIQYKMKNYISSSKGVPYDRIEEQSEDFRRSIKEMISFNSLNHQHKFFFEETDS